jgi:Zn-dependent protease with chaperone function
MNFREQERRSKLEIWFGTLCVVLALCLGLVGMELVLAWGIRTAFLDHCEPGTCPPGLGLDHGLAIVAIALLLIWELIEVRAEMAWLTTQRLAHRLGGRKLRSDTRDLHERRLLNIVEECALAAGMRPLSVYVMRREHSINALTIGRSPMDCLVMLTDGALRLLKREELQAIVAHEFGHVLANDLRLNERTMKLLVVTGSLPKKAWRAFHRALLAPGKFFFSVLEGSKPARGVMRVIQAAVMWLASLAMIGIFGLFIFGEAGGLLLGFILFALAYACMLLWCALLTLPGLVGGFGFLVTQLIFSSVNREQEHRADAGAVRLTRNPLALANALVKISHPNVGSRLRAPASDAISHMCFVPAITVSLQEHLASHPSIAERLTKLGPAGKEASQRLKQSGALRDAVNRFRKEVEQELGIVFAAPETTAPDGTSPQESPQWLAAEPNLGLARRILGSLPDDIRGSLRQPAMATALSFALLLPTNPSSRATRLTWLETRGLDREDVRSCLSWLDRFGLAARLPLFDLAVPALRTLASPRREQLLVDFKDFIQSDGTTALDEYITYSLLLAVLRTQRAELAGPDLEFHQHDFRLVLGACVRHATEPNKQHRAFSAGLRAARFPEQPVDESAVSLEMFVRAIGRLRNLHALQKPRVIVALAAAFEEDGRVQASELELLRSIGATIDCPIPPQFDLTVPLRVERRARAPQ